MYTIMSCMCTRLQNYTLVYMNMATGQNSVLKMKKRLKQSTEHIFVTYCNIKTNWMNVLY